LGGSASQGKKRGEKLVGASAENSNQLTPDVDSAPAVGRRPDFAEATVAVRHRRNPLGVGLVAEFDERLGAGEQLSAERDELGAEAEARLGREAAQFVAVDVEWLNEFVAHFNGRLLMNFIRIKTQDSRELAIRLDAIVEIDFMESGTAFRLANGSSATVSAKEGEAICKLLQVKSLEGIEA
jgi:hypothetical protein